MGGKTSKEERKQSSLDHKNKKSGEEKKENRVDEDPVENDEKQPDNDSVSDDLDEITEIEEEIEFERIPKELLELLPIDILVYTILHPFLEFPLESDSTHTRLDVYPDFYGYFKHDSGRKTYMLWDKIHIEDVATLEYWLDDLPLNIQGITVGYSGNDYTKINPSRFRKYKKLRNLGETPISWSPPPHISTLHVRVDSDRKQFSCKPLNTTMKENLEHLTIEKYHLHYRKVPYGSSAYCRSDANENFIFYRPSPRNLLETPNLRSLCLDGIDILSCDEKFLISILETCVFLEKLVLVNIGGLDHQTSLSESQIIGVLTSNVNYFETERVYWGMEGLSNVFERGKEVWSRAGAWMKGRVTGNTALFVFFVREGETKNCENEEKVFGKGAKEYYWVSLKYE